MTLVYFLIVIGILVFVHELGHFIVAKRAGVRVEKFSLGMGPKLFGYKKGDTEYVISALPLGGYVKMAGENPDEEPTGDPAEFQNKSVWDRAKIVATGPLTNLLLAFLIMPAVYLIGTNVTGPAKVAIVEKDSPAEKAGFLRGDVIEKVNGKAVDEWKQALTLIAVNPNIDVPVEIDRNGEKKTLLLHPVPDGDLQIGSSGLIPDMPAQIVSVAKDSPAEKAGIQPGDKIVSVDGERVYNYDQFSPMINRRVGRPVSIVVERKGKSVTVVTTPMKNKRERYVIGVEIRPILEWVFRKFGVWEAVMRGFRTNLYNIELTFVVMKKLLTLQLSIKNVGGPVMIAQLSGEAAKSGFSSFLEFLALISISLGILNLLPIPVLDGGMLLFLLIEAVRKKPLSKRVMEVSQSIGAALLITLIVVVSYNDVMRWFFSK